VREEALVVAIFALVSVAWTWPLALDPATTTVALHFDVYPAAWLAQAAPTFVPGGSTPLTGFPEGESLARMDSYLFLLLSVLLRAPGMAVVNGFVLLGPVVSAWAAARFAREASAASTGAAVAAGLAFGFGPLALVAALEGHVYVLLDPWLPLGALAVWRGRAGAAAVHFGLALLTSAYLGIDAGLLAVGVLWARRAPVVVWARVLGWMGVVGVGYAAAYLSAPAGPAVAGGDALVRLGAATLTTLVAWTPWVDVARHSLGPVIGVAPAAVAAVAWGALERTRGVEEPDPAAMRRLVVVGALAAVGALGPVVQAGVSGEGGPPAPLWPLLPLGVLDVWRFPVRLAWISALCFGAAAAALARARGGWGLAVLVLVDVLFVSGAAWRLRTHPAPAPSLYAQLPEAAVLELFPDVGGAQEDIPYYTQKLPCLYQNAHGRPILERCITTDRRASPRAAAARELHARLLTDASAETVAEGVRAVVAAAEVGSVVVHADLYAAHERADVVRGLSAAYGEPREGRDGGEWLLAWRVR
jgi:hypothetical protein